MYCSPDGLYELVTQGATLRGSKAHGCCGGLRRNYAQPLLHKATPNATKKALFLSITYVWIVECLQFAYTGSCISL